MARVYELAAEISRVFEQYQAIHDEVFGLSLRRLRGALGAGVHNNNAARAQKLQQLALELRGVCRAVGELDNANLPSRLKGLVRTALIDYSLALEEAISRLQSICDSLQSESDGSTDGAGYRERGFRSDKIAYDDSVQAYKRLGARLTDLFAKL